MSTTIIETQVVIVSDTEVKMLNAAQNNLTLIEQELAKRLQLKPEGE